MELLLHIVILLPLVGALTLIFFNNEHIIKVFSLVLTTATFVLSLPLLLNFIPGEVNYLSVYGPMVPGIDVKYIVGLDGLSMLLFMLTTFFGPIVVLSGWSYIKDHIRGFYAMVMILQTGSLGVFATLDLFMFYIFFELTQIPMLFLIGIWGGENRIYATVKFFIYTLVGWLLMLVALIYVGTAAGNMLNDGVFTTDWRILTSPEFKLGLVEQTWLFVTFGFAFCIKIPIMPFHSWLPLAHTEAPTPGSVILAAISLKMGTYAVIRYLLPLFPNAAISFAPAIAILGVIGIIYGALVAMVQKDVKKLVAYSSISHMGFIVLGMFAYNTIAMQGAIIQMVNHGLATGALFLIIGMLYERRHTRAISDFGGLSSVVPVMAVMFMIATLASIGLPGLNGFVGEFLILLGSFNSEVLNSYWYVVFAATGVILAAVYMLWMFRRVMFGPVTHEENKNMKDLNFREIALLTPIMIFIVWIGIRPGDFLQYSEVQVEQYLQDQLDKAAEITAEAHYQELPGWASRFYDITPQVVEKINE